MAAAVVDPNKLPKKEAELFKTIVKSYESKQYKKGIKTAETILKKFPTNGETLAMKGLILNSIGKKEDAHENVKLGLRYNVRSHICWHVYGLVHRSDNNYKEASKCYLNALRIDCDNQNILRDLSWLQMQTRDVAGFIASRKRLLTLRPTVRNNWVTFAAANYMGGEYAVAFDVVTRYNESGSERAGVYEEGELVLFQNKCLEKQCKYVECIEHLDTIESMVVDKLAWKIKKAELLLRARRFEDAKEQWLALVLSQTENYRLHSGLQAAYLELDAETSGAMFSLKKLDLPCTVLSLSTAQQDTLKELYNSNSKLKSSRAVTKICLTLVRGEEFRLLLDAHCRHCLSEGVPSLQHDICDLIRGTDPLDPRKSILISDPYDFRAHPVTIVTMELVNGYIRNLKACSSFDGEGAVGDGADPVAPTALLWAQFLCCHLLEKSGLLPHALAMIDECIDHTPTALDMYAKKGRVLKKSGDLVQAAEVVELMRTLDLQDRYLNNKATKYFLRADMIQRGMETIAMFTKDDGDPEQTLSYLQCNWYELESGEAYSRTKQWGLALKKFYSIRKHFADYVDDMFDFHHFSMRKNTLRAYIDSIAMQDEIYTHKFFQRAAKRVLSLYLHLLDTPEDIDGLAHLSAADRKKERAKLKKKKAKEAQDEEDRAKEDAKWGSGGGGKDKDDEDAPVKDSDPKGEKLLQKDFLTEAVEWSNLVLLCAQNADPDTLALAAEVFMRREKLTQVLRLLRCGLAQSPLHPALTVMLVKFARKWREQDISKKEGVARARAEKVAPVVAAELADLLKGLELHAFVAQYAEQVKELNSLPHRLAAARCLVINAAAKKTAPAKQAALKLLLDETAWGGRGVSVKNAVDVYKYLASDLKLEGEAAQFKALAHAHFPLALDFQESLPAPPDLLFAPPGLVGGGGEDAPAVGGGGGGEGP